MRVPNTIQVSASVYFLAKDIVGYFEVKKCSYMFRVRRRNRFLIVKSGLKVNVVIAHCKVQANNYKMMFNLSPVLNSPAIFY